MLRRDIIGLGIGLVILSCDGPVQPPEAAHISVVLVSGSDQTGSVGEELPDGLVVRVTRGEGQQAVVPNYLVNFRVLSGGGSVFAGSTLTDARGYARDYWTLGPLPGDNVLEVRAVDPSTGEKRVFGRFVAHGVVPGPEVCNGLDDDLNGAVDDPTWIYCRGGVPAAHTDGRNSCVDAYVDLNGNPADGCEQLVAGTWTLAPAVTLTCPDFSPYLSDLTLSGFVITPVGPGELRVVPQANAGGPLGPFFGTFLTPSWTVTPIPGTSSVAGTAPFDIISDDGQTRVRATGVASLTAAFTGPTSFQATLGLTIDIRVAIDIPGVPLDLELGGPCNDLNVTVAGTRTGP